VCNVATQQGETEGFTVADHVAALEAHVGRGVFDAILANNSYPSRNAGDSTHYVLPGPESQAVYQRYELVLADLTDEERPWRHDPVKLAGALLAMVQDATQAVPVHVDAAASF